VADLAELLEQWRSDLAAWAIPSSITAAVAESPWVMPRQVFARRADRLATDPGGSSYDRAWEALDPPGAVLDVGSGPGTACLPLIPRATSVTAVDSDQAMLGLLADRAAARSVQARCVLGSWPQVGPQVPVADVVTCHHVLYNVPDLGPFIKALTGHARRRVVLETAMTHPLTSLNPLWLKFHGLARPDRPTAADALAILAAMGLTIGQLSWRRPAGSDYASFDELTGVTRRRLCLPPERTAEVANALIELGVDPDDPLDLGSSGRDVLTIWWDSSVQV
jgi:2-polyprenyl-3-methyl-5-hydroxy-6-metoxy-1,4-benzoquinol methylase